MKAISLCGGGSKGSYEMGAWDAFKELNMTFEIVTGTSIGCLNGAMMVQQDYNRCEDLWTKIKINRISTNAFDVDELSFIKFIRHDNFKPFFKEYIKGFGIDIKPFKELLNEYVNPKKIKESKVRFGVVISTFPIMKKEEVIISDVEEDKIMEYLIASAAAFPVFPICKIDGTSYVDGGYTDNLPIDLAFKMGASSVVAVDLSYEINHKEYINHPFVDYIYPKWDLGSFLNFNPDVLARNRLLGYYDTMKYYGKYEGYKYTFNKIKGFVDLSNKITSTITNDQINFKDKKKKNYFKKENYVNIYSIINLGINKEIKYYDYLIKCLEEFGVLYDIYPGKSYPIKEFMKKVIEHVKLENSDAIKDEFNELKNDGKKRDFIEECDKKLFLNFLYKNDFDDNFRMLLLQTNPEMYLCYVYLKSL